MFYPCQGVCSEPQVHHNWIPVFELLWESWACVRYVDIHFAPHEPQPIRRGSMSPPIRCRFEWDENVDGFWWGLQMFTMAHEIRFANPVPGYFVRQQAKQLGWHVEGTAI
ncbi:hypothetical protein C8A01DRAFT_31730 [Parachaetomium inaequale]|uniref:Uncharacterized protein n=1 Tax=Parachaetomium inaequale TaxID=2588326 RepID=A0AAN6PQI1_9PEZI|nr:hypothetical protein C8A01DRAFT_31730 [Parachaetomium inaequale]